MKNSKIIMVFFIIILLFSVLSPNFFCKEIKNFKNIETEKDFIENDFLLGFNFKFFKNRFVIYKMPDTSPSTKGYPVVFLFHGAVQHAFSWFFGLNMWNRAQVSFSKCLIDNGFFVVGLESLKPIKPGPRAWDAFEKDDTLNSDILFVKEVIDWLSNSSLPVDTNKTYCAGFSSGAFFCSRLAQSYDFGFKGVILNSGCNADSISISNMGPVFNCSTGFNISLFHPPALLIHGKEDKLVSIVCTESYYQDLMDNNIEVTKLIDEDAGHIWLKDYNQLIIDWLKK